MTKDEDFKLLKIQTCVLKVNMHCDGCKQKVKKLLRRIEGVYQVNIDAEQQRVTVSGSVDAATLITKLVRAGKHAELWSHNSNQNQKQKNNCIKDDKNNKGQKQGQVKDRVKFQNQQNFPSYIGGEDEYFDDDDEDVYEEDELAFLGNNANELGLIRQAINASNAKKGLGGQPTNTGKINNHLGNVNVGKKENPNQNMGMKMNPDGIDQKTLAALKMNNLNLNGGKINAGEGRRTSDIGAMMGLAGFPANGGINVANVPNPAALGGNPNGVGGFQVPHNNNNAGFQGSSSAGLFPNGGYATGQQRPSSMLMNMSGYNHPSMMMNRQQPQMMYHRSPYIAPNTGYYYNAYPPPSYYPEPPPPPQQPNYGGDHSDENSSSCSIM